MHSPQCPDDLFRESSDASGNRQHEGDQAEARVNGHHCRSAAVGGVLAAQQHEEAEEEEEETKPELD